MSGPRCFGEETDLCHEPCPELRLASLTGEIRVRGFIGGKTSAGNRANPVYEPRLQVELSSGFVRADFCVGSSHSENASSKEEGYLFHKGCGRP